MKEHDPIDTKLASSRPTLTPEAKAALFQRIEAAVVPVVMPASTPAFVASPYIAFLRRPVALALVVVLSVTTLTTAAQAAKPGDALFPVEQLSEELRYLVTPASFRGELRTAYAEQRLHELKRIATTPGTDTEVEQETERLSLAVSVLLAELDELENDTAREAVAAELLASLNPQTVRARIQNDRFELRDDNVRIRFKDGEWRYRYDNHHEDDDHDDEDSDDVDDDHDDDRNDNDFRWRVTDTPRSNTNDSSAVDHDDDRNDDPDDEDSDDVDDDRDDDSSGSDRDDDREDPVDDRDEDSGEDDNQDDDTSEDRHEDDATSDDRNDRDDDSSGSDDRDDDDDDNRDNRDDDEDKEDTRN